MDQLLLDSTVGVLNTSLNLRLLNQNIISSNIANADTPEFKAKVLEFEIALRNLIQLNTNIKPMVSDPQHLLLHATDPVSPQIYEDPHGVESLDGNTVDRGKEMVKLAENQLLFDSSVEMLKKKLGLLKYVLSEGGAR